MTEMMATEEDEILMAMEDDGFFDDLATMVMSAENPQEEEMLEKTSLPSSPLVEKTKSPVAPTGRPPIPLYLSCNPDKLSEYQCLIRKEMEFFEALQLEVDSNAKGRNRPVVLGQVGIRCRHCRFVPPLERTRGAQYFPTTLEGIYQAAQILANGHLNESCTYVPPHLREELLRLKQQKSHAMVGKEYWAGTAQALGVYEADDGILRFAPRLGMLGPTTYITKQDFSRG
jgi:hypothetical protein